MTEDKPHGEPGGKSKTKPEEVGHPVPGVGEAIEPEATHIVTNPAETTGDRMWGPPGSQEKR